MGGLRDLVIFEEGVGGQTTVEVVMIAVKPTMYFVDQVFVPALK